MAVCSNCKAEGPRVRSRWTEKNVQLPDECPNCAPDSFDKFQAPSDKKIWMGYEAHPNEYEKKYDKDGLIYERKPEYRHEQEEKLSQATVEEQEAQERAIANKRKNRRTREMDSVEFAAALRRAEEVADFIVASTSQGRNVN